MKGQIIDSKSAELIRDNASSLQPAVSSAAPADSVPCIGLQFTETMRGYFARGADRFERGARQGKLAGSHFQFTLTVITEDLEAMLASPTHEARIIGTATAPALSPKPLAATEGAFNLLVTDARAPSVRRMTYSMKLSADDGREYLFDGFKVIRHGRARHLWHDTTTLYITLRDGADRRSPVLGKGILKISPGDFLRQLTTFEVKNARTLADRLEAEMRFGRFFAGALYRTYI